MSAIFIKLKCNEKIKNIAVYEGMYIEELIVIINAAFKIKKKVLFLTDENNKIYNLNSPMIPINVFKMNKLILEIK